MHEQFQEWVGEWAQATGKGESVRAMRAEVLRILREEWPEVAQGARDTPDDRERKRHVLRRLRAAVPDALAKQKLKNDAFMVERAIYAFAMILDRGNRFGIWRITLPALKIRIARRRSPVNPYRFVRLQKSCDMAHALSRSLTVAADKSVRDVSIRSLLSAILHGGLVSWPEVERLLRLRLTDLRAGCGQLWVDFPTGTATNTERPDIPGASANERDQDSCGARWFADPRTALLLLHCRQSGGESLAALIGPEPALRPAALLEQVRAFLFRFECPRASLPKSMAELLDCGAARLHFATIGMVASFAQGEVHSRPLSPLAWARVRTGLARSGAALPRATEAPMYRQLRESGAAPESGEEPQPQLGYIEWFRTLLREVKRAAARRGGARKTITAQILEEARRDGIAEASMLGSLVAWCCALIEQRGAARLRLNSVHRYLTAVGKRLLERAGAMDVRTASEEDFVALYESVLDALPSGTSRSYAAKQLRTFHDFLVAKGSAVSIDYADVNGFDEADAATCGNVLTPWEYDAAYALLKPRAEVAGGSEPDERRRWVGTIGLILGYRLGLRIGESRRLLICDVVMKGAPEIRIVSNRYGKVKSVSGRRRLPVGVLLNAREQRLLRLWLRRRECETGGNRNALLLSLHPQAIAPIAPEVIRAPVQEAMRRVSGDPSLTFKDLRHSCGTWLTMTLLGDAIPGAIDPAIAAFRHPDFSSERRARITRFFFPSGNGAGAAIHPVGPALFQVASLLGHSGPDVSVTHYVHMLDYLLGCAVRSEAPALSIEQLKMLLGVRQARAYVIAKAAHTNFGLDPNVVLDAAVRRIKVAPDPLEKKLTKPELTAIEISAFKAIGGPEGAEIVELAELVTELAAEDPQDALRALDGWAAHNHIPAEPLRQWYRAAQAVCAAYPTRSKRMIKARGDVLPHLPHGRDERQELGRYLSRLLGAVRDAGTQNIVTWGVQHFLSRTISRNEEARHPASQKKRKNRTHSEITFARPEPAQRYLRFLEVLGVGRSDVHVRHLAHPASAEEALAAQRRWWACRLGIPEQAVAPAGAGKGRASGSRGWIALSVQNTGFASWRSRGGTGKPKPVRQSSRAFRVAIHLYAIWRRMQQGESPAGAEGTR